MSSLKMLKGDEFIHIQAGAGGFGNPLTRDPKFVLRDYLNELIDKKYAEHVYGVIIEGNKLCLKKTKSKRNKLKQNNNHKYAHFKLFHNSVGIPYKVWKRSYFGKSNEIS